MQLKRLLVIPARGNSKRIKNKNFKNFKGKPIISYSINTAIKSKLFDHIIVSIDDVNKIKYLKKFKVKIDIRPKKYAKDHSTIEDVLRNIYYNYLNKNIRFNEVWSLTPCSPLIKTSDLIKASKLLKKNKNRIVLPVCEYSAPISWAFKRNKRNILYPLKKNAYKIRSQDLPKNYHDTGNFVCIPFTFFKKKKKIEFDKNYVGLKIPKIRSVDIDDLEDWKIAEAFYEKK